MPGVAINEMKRNSKLSRSTTGSLYVEAYKIDRQSKLRIRKMGLYIDWSKRYVGDVKWVFMLIGRKDM